MINSTLRLMRNRRNFLPDTDGSTADWLVLAAGVVLLGMAIVYELFIGATNDLVSEMNQGMAENGELGAKPDGRPDRLEAGECESPPEFGDAENCRVEDLPRP